MSKTLHIQYLISAFNNKKRLKILEILNLCPFSDIIKVKINKIFPEKSLHFGEAECINSIESNSSNFQFFIGLPGYQDAVPFVPSLLAEFCKRLTDEVLAEINEMIIECSHLGNLPSGGPCGNDKKSTVSPALEEDTKPQN